VGRPKIEIPEDAVYKLARLGATNTDIADFYGCDETTIRKRFPEILAKGRAERRNTLRQWQWDAAQAGNVTMLIWLGKQDLGQSDRADVTSGGAALKGYVGFDAEKV
jgi:hypothetical protein